MPLKAPAAFLGSSSSARVVIGIGMDLGLYEALFATLLLGGWLQQVAGPGRFWWDC